MLFVDDESSEYVEIHHNSNSRQLREQPLTQRQKDTIGIGDSTNDSTNSTKTTPIKDEETSHKDIIHSEKDHLPPPKTSKTKKQTKISINREDSLL
jgi:hypothetical protein